jgi:hypothetical protein
VPRPSSLREWFKALASVRAPIVSWYLVAYLRGMLVACFDHARGQYELQTFGFPAFWLWEKARLLDEKYKVKLHTAGYCIVTESLHCYITGYNSVSRKLLMKKFGYDIFRECTELARQNIRNTLPPERDAKTMR